ncbi:MAG TPA: tetratricopeptide repeat protein [Terriglobia bacterium]|nr:tetratricopeptide repeat protein [Terriglobia bacterium]
MKSHLRHDKRKEDAARTALVAVALLIMFRPESAKVLQQASPEPIENAITLALEQGANKQASADLDQLLAQPQADSTLVLRVGIAFAQKGLYSEASRAFTRVVNDRPDLFEGHYNLALSELAEGQLHPALEAIEQAPHASEEDVTARLYLRGKIRAALGEGPQAEQDLSAAFAKQPGQENYALDLGLLYLRAHAYTKSESVFARGLKSNPRSPYLLLGLALAQFLGGRTSQSVDAARRLVAAEPDFSPARLLLGFTLYFDGNLDAARRVASDGLALPDPNPYLYYLDAAALLKQHGGEYARILSDLGAAEKALPACALCYVASGKAREEQNDLAGALSDFQTAVRLAPGLSEGWYHLATVADRMGKREQATEARQHFQQMKASEDEREKEMMRDVLLQNLGAEGPGAPP